MTFPFSSKDLPAALQRSRRKAEELLRHPARLQQLFTDTQDKIRRVETGPLIETLAELKTMGRLCKAYADGSYRKIGWNTMALVAGAVLYFLNPLDLLPDFLPLGFLDDAGIVILALKSVKDDLEAFRQWEESENREAKVSDDVLEMEVL